MLNTFSFYCFIHSIVSKDDSEDDVDGDSNKDSNDDDDDDDTDGEDEDRAVQLPSHPQLYMVLSDFKGEQKGDLSIQVKFFLFHQH